MVKLFKKTVRRYPKFRKMSAFSIMVPLSFIPQPATAQTLPLVVSAPVELNFGSVTAGGAGTVVISTTGTRSVTGGVTAVNSGGLESNGVFSISGSTGFAIDLSITATSFTVSNGGGGVMNVDSFQMIAPAGGRTATVTLATNPETFPLGATLNVGAGQAEGTYIGDYMLSANYQ